MSRVRNPAELLRYIAYATRRKTPVARLLNQERRCDLKSSLSSVTELRDKKRLVSYSDSTIGFLGPDLAAPKMHCSTTVIRRQEARQEARGPGVYGVHITDAEDVVGMRTRPELISITGQVHITVRMYVSICALELRIDASLGGCILRELPTIRRGLASPDSTETSRNLMIRCALISGIAGHCETGEI